MKKWWYPVIAGLASLAMGKRPPLGEIPMNAEKFYSFKVKDIHGKERSLSEFKGKALLIVNVATYCGNTPQYEGLERIYKKYKGRGFEVLGFPANEFGAQEPGTEAQILEFCKTKYGVEFPMFSKIVVKGEGMHPLYEFLTKETAFPGEIGWNFAKFLVAKDGRVVARFSPKSQPESGELLSELEKAL